MWLKGSVRVYVQSVFGEPDRRWSSAATMTRGRSPSSAWHRHGVWACGIDGASRDLRHARGQGGDRCGPRHRSGTNVGGGSYQSRERGSGITAGPRPDGAVVIGCRGPLACGGGQRRGLARSGVVHIQLARGMSGCRVCCGWAASRRRCHRVVTSGVGHGGTRGDTVRRFLLVGGKGGTRWDG
jgi:hypothetical protein